MDMGLSEVQQMLKTSAQEFLSRECPPTLVREAEESPGGYSAELWRQMTALGWPGVPFPEQYGGTGGDFLDLAALLEEMGRALAPTPFFATVVLGGLTVLDAGSARQKSDILPGICAGTLTMTLALTEESAAYEPWGVAAAAVPDGAEYVLNGVKLFVPDAAAANLLIVAARTASAVVAPEDRISLFLLPADTDGVEISRLNSIGDERSFEVRLNEVRLPQSALLGGVNEGWPVVERALQRAVAGQCIEMLGGAAAVLDMTAEYVKQRTQFGRPVGSFQAIQHHLSEMATDVEGSRGIAYQAAWRLAQGQPARREASMAKAWVSQAYRRVCSTAHQCHGAIGFTKEHNLQLYTRRAKVQELSYGDLYRHKELAMANLDAD